MTAATGKKPPVYIDKERIGKMTVIGFASGSRHVTYSFLFLCT